MPDERAAPVNVDAWLTSLMVTPPVILGRRLRPFSLTHSFLLERAGNPFWVGGPRDAEHFFEAVDICAHDLESNRERIAGKVGWKFSRWVAKSFRKLNAREVETFARYMDDHLTCCPRESSSGREMVSPWQFRLVVDLVRNGFSESAAWNMPLNLARCYYDARAEMDGDDTLVRDETADAYELIARANKLMEEGNTKEADELYGIAQAEFDRRNHARERMKEIVNG